MEQSTHRVRLSHILILLDGFIVVFECLNSISFFLIHGSTCQIALSICGVYAKQFVQIFLGLVIIFLLNVDNTHIYERKLIVRIVIQRHFIIFQRPVVIILILTGIGSQLICLRYKGISLQCQRTIVFRSFKVVEVIFCDCPVKIRLGKIRLCFYHLIEILNSKHVIFIIKRISTDEDYSIRIYLGKTRQTAE